MHDTRTRILEAARQVYLERGHQGVTMREVASRVGLTATAIYRHFDDKEALIDEVLEDGFRVFANYLHRSLEGRDPAERLRLSGEAYLRFGLDEPQFYRTIFMSERSDGSWAGVDHPRSRSTFRFLVDRVRECVSAGVLTQDDPEDLAMTIWAHTHGLVSLQLSGVLGISAEEFQTLYARSLRHLIEGIRA